MDNLMQALDNGKRRGYEELRVVENKKQLFQYFLKKEKGQYFTYVMCIEESRMDNFEDYAIERVECFLTFGEAVNYLRGNGADIEKFGAVKRTLPF